MRTRLKLKQQSQSTFNALLAEACQIALDVRQHDTVAGNKLTAEAFVEMAQKIARVTSKELRQLRAAITDEDYPNAAAALRRAVEFVKSPHCTAPPKKPNRLAFLVPEHAKDELAILKTSTAALFALAARIVAEKHPDSFGPVEDWERHHSQLQQQRQRLDDLKHRLGHDYSDEDTRAERKGSDWQVSYRISNGEVQIHPDAGEELINWCLAHPHALRTLGVKLG